MKHIVTKSDKESKARVKYAEAKESAVVASDDLEAKVANLLALRHKMDEDELRKSQLMGEIMEEMKTATVLKNKQGTVIVTWKMAGVSSKTDWKGIVNKMKVPANVINEFTTSSLGARTFELIESQDEVKDIHVDKIDTLKI